MYRILCFAVVFFFFSADNQAQEKPLWEALNCDTTLVAKQIMGVRPMVLTLFKKDSMPLVVPKRLIFGTKDSESGISWLILPREEVTSETVLDSISKQYLSLLLPPTQTLYERWEPWLSTLRADFLQRRDSLILYFKDHYPLYSIKVISDQRTREDQQKVLKSGYSQAHLSFHELGLASDFGIYRNKKYTTQARHYMMLDSLTQKFKLRWGGHFVGFVDMPHVQYYYNSAELLRKHPFLGIEYEYFYHIYVKRVRDRIVKGEEHLVEDSKELLFEINKLRKEEPCFCRQANAVLPLEYYPDNYNSTDDLLLVLDRVNGVFWAQFPKQPVKKYRIGVWK
jgi:peptidoglycan LD-endopeptidase CwlK